MVVRKKSTSSLDKQRLLLEQMAKKGQFGARRLTFATSVKTLNGTNADYKTSVKTLYGTNAD